MSSQPTSILRPPGGSRVSTCNGFAADFPILNQEVHGEPLVYFDNGAYRQKPRAYETRSNIIMRRTTPMFTEPPMY